jgi:hypothetical protein
MNKKNLREVFKPYFNDRAVTEHEKHILLLTDLLVRMTGKPQVILIASHARSNASSFPILGR